MEYQRIGAWRHVPAASTDRPSGGSWNAAGMFRWVVFGTLLGPEATGPGGTAFGCGVRDLCFWFPGCIDRACCVCGVCGTGLLFENYIVDASIFYKKQFPRI